eukprot:m.146942 g.146942  ORF g.146942 m.146942 type:complete len:879 (+) comp16247_c0_seq1:218-2854(+)
MMASAASASPPAEAQAPVVSSPTTIIVPSDYIPVKRPLPDPSTVSNAPQHDNPFDTTFESDPIRLALHWLAAPDVEIRESSLEAARLLGALQVDNFKLLLRLVDEPDFLTSDACRNLLCLLEANHQATSFLLQLVEQDIANEETTEMLFRRNTPATKLISAYFRLVGQDFLRASLAPSIQDACNSEPLRKVSLKGHLHANADQKSPSVDDEDNFQPLIKACQTIADMIVQNLIRLPHGFRALTVELYNRVEARFPGHGHVVIRGFVFLRLICPALINPHDYYLLDGPPDQVHVDSLKIMARLTQHLANSTGSKETLRLPRNIDSASVQAFILQNRQAMLEFVQELTQPSKIEAIVVPVLSRPAPALWCCQRCVLVNRHERKRCLSCQLEYISPIPHSNVNTLTQAARTLGAHVALFLEALQADFPQLSCVTTLRLSAKDLLLQSAASFSCASSTFSSPRRLGSRQSSRQTTASLHRNPTELQPEEASRLATVLLQEDCAMLHRMLLVTPSAQYPVHGMMLFTMAHGVGLRFLQQLFTTLATCDLPSSRWLNACQWGQRLEPFADLLSPLETEETAEPQTPRPLVTMALQAVGTYAFSMLAAADRQAIRAALLRQLELTSSSVTTTGVVTAVQQALLSNDFVPPLLHVLGTCTPLPMAVQLLAEQVTLTSLEHVCHSARDVMGPRFQPAQACQLVSQLTRLVKQPWDLSAVVDGSPLLLGPSLALIELARTQHMAVWPALGLRVLQLLRVWLLELFDIGVLQQEDLSASLEEVHRHRLVDRLATVLQDGGYITRSVSHSQDRLSSAQCESELKHWTATTTMRVNSAPESRAEPSDLAFRERRRRASTHDSSFSQENSGSHDALRVDVLPGFVDLSVETT